MNILVIEDHLTDLKLLSAVLDEGGHQVIGVVSAELAILEIAKRQPEFVLLDLKLPGIDGLALARMIKADPVTTHIPIIAMSASTQLFTSQSATDAGCEAFIVKPLNTRKLIATIKHTETPERIEP